MNTVLIVAIFTFLIHFTESAAYSMRVSGVITKQVSIAMAFVTSTLLVSRLSNMFQAPLLGNMVDTAVMISTEDALLKLVSNFRIILLGGVFGIIFAAVL